MKKIHYAPKIMTASEKTILRTAAHCRVSTFADEQTDSFETQCSHYRELIGNDSTKSLAGIYADRMSGLHMNKRPAFSQLIRDCENGLIDLVITKSVSRFSRNMADCVSTVNRLKALNIPVIFEKEGINSLDRNSELFLTVLAIFAQEESAHMSRNIRWAQEHAAQLGRPVRKAAYGYRQDKNREWHICEPESRRVRRAYDMALQMHSYSDMVDSLNAMESLENTNVRWTQARLRTMFCNEVYKGDLLTNKTYTVSYLNARPRKNNGDRTQYYIEEHHEGIVTADEYAQVLSLVESGLLKSGARRRKTAYQRTLLRDKEQRMTAAGERKAAGKEAAGA